MKQKYKIKCNRCLQTQLLLNLKQKKKISLNRKRLFQTKINSRFFPQILRRISPANRSILAQNKYKKHQTLQFNNNKGKVATNKANRLVKIHKNKPKPQKAKKKNKKTITKIFKSNRSDIPFYKLCNDQVLLQSLQLNIGF